MFYASVYFQKHFEKSKTFKSEQDARRFLVLEAAYTDNVKDYKLCELSAEGWRLIDFWSC